MSPIITDALKSDTPIVSGKPILSIASTILTPIVKTAIDNKITAIAETQDTKATLFSTGKFLQIPLTKEADYEYEVFELVSPRGETGYITYFYKTDGIKKYIKSVGFGLDAEEHTRDWYEYILDLK